MKRYLTILGIFIFTLFAHSPILWCQTVEGTTVIIDASSTTPIGTGLTINSTDDNFVIIADGLIRIPALATWIFSNGWIEPAGLVRLRRMGQVFADIPYAAVIGTFDTLDKGFYIGKGGTFTAASIHVNKELKIGLNMNNADQTSMHGQFIIHVIKIPSSATNIPEHIYDSVPTLNELEQNYPNPFNLTTKIQYTTSKSGPVLLRIYDQRGRLIRTIVNEPKSIGSYQVLWDGRDDNGVVVSSAVYFYQLSTTTHTETKKLALLK